MVKLKIARLIEARVSRSACVIVRALEEGSLPNNHHGGFHIGKTDRLDLRNLITLLGPDVRIVQR